MCPYYCIAADWHRCLYNSPQKSLKFESTTNVLCCSVNHSLHSLCPSKFNLVTQLVAEVYCILYIAKLSSGKTFAVFQPIVKVFPLNHLLCTAHDGHGLMHHENFAVYGIQLLAKIIRNSR